MVRTEDKFLCAVAQIRYDCTKNIDDNFFMCLFLKFAAAKHKLENGLAGESN